MRERLITASQLAPGMMLLASYIGILTTRYGWMRINDVTRTRIATGSTLIGVSWEDESWGGGGTHYNGLTRVCVDADDPVTALLLERLEEPCPG